MVKDNFNIAAFNVKKYFFPFHDAVIRPIMHFNLRSFPVWDLIKTIGNHTPKYPTKKLSTIQSIIKQ